MNIDWSKAPEDATHYAEVDSSRVCWYMVKSESEYAYAYQDEGFSCERWTEICGSPGHKPLIERPKKQEAWGGEGLPPIGIDCEVYDCQHEYTKKFNGQTVRIVAHHLNLLGNRVAVFEAADCVYHGLVSEKFRPIKTAEQLAEEERKSQILDMIDSFGTDTAIWGRDAVMEICGHLWEYGYRKQ